jgi:hypothetical protein
LFLGSDHIPNTENSSNRAELRVARVANLPYAARSNRRDFIFGKLRLRFQGHGDGDRVVIRPRPRSKRQTNLCGRDAPKKSKMCLTAFFGPLAQTCNRDRGCTCGTFVLVTVTPDRKKSFGRHPGSRSPTMDRYTTSRKQGV